MTTKVAFVSADTVSKTYPKFVLTDFSIQAAANETIGLLGDTGAGKTTILDILAGLISPDGGSIQRETDNIGYCFAQLPFPRNLTINRLVHIFRHLAWPWQDRVFADYVTDFALPRRTPVARLTKSQQAALNLAVTLAHNAPLLLLDEVTENLAPDDQPPVLAALQAYRYQHQAGIVLATRRLDDIQVLCDRFILLKQGQTVTTLAADAYRGQDLTGIIKHALSDRRQD
jgi:ABC-type multidrug transport system ATPase subunit